MKDSRRIDPLLEFDHELLGLEKPARYLGGELGSLAPLAEAEGEGLLLMALSFPDLYEIGMSNNAIRILYEGLNRLEGLRCERVFAPAPDFEALLRRRGLPLFTLESGLPLYDLDILGFSVGYELAATSLLAVLDLGGIPLRARERGEGDPIVIAGGPAMVNPHYLAPFLDAVYIGEAEEAFYPLAEELARLKKAGASRTELLGRMAREPAMWLPGKKAIRADFGRFDRTTYHTARPIPVLRTVQEHGTVEIMRGCPNGCRFCQAGYYYRPMRMKSMSVIRSEVESLVREGGYREITLSSLSSGDYAGIDELLASLNVEWAPRGVSFQLPSLKVSSFTLPLIEALSQVRKSGLTFAVETPTEAWQLAINKDVSFEKTLAILEEARTRGFKLAKFYFMIGLPVSGRGRGEAEAIVDFLDRLASRLSMSFNVNIGTFVPKPQTPFQWCGQLGEDEALEAISTIRTGLKHRRSIKISYHSPFVSLLESVFCRGDERVGELILEAYRRGARLDAWEDHFDRELWRSILEAADWNPIERARRDVPLEESLPWDDVSLRVSKAYLRKEFKRSQTPEFTSRCEDKCTHSCGSCLDEAGIVYNSEHIKVDPTPVAPRSAKVGRLLLSLSKVGSGRYYSHLSVIETLSRAFLMLDLPVSFSEGFNPLPRLEMVQPLPLGFSSAGELASVILAAELAGRWREEGTLGPLQGDLNRVLPEGLRVVELAFYPLVPEAKPRSLGSLAWGSVFSIEARSGSAFDLSALAASLEARILELAIPGAELRQEHSRIFLRLPDPRRKEEGFSRILAGLLSSERIQERLLLGRAACLARGAEGPVSYFEALSL